MVKYVINFELLSVIKNNSVIAMSVITRVDCTCIYRLEINNCRLEFVFTG